MGMFQVLLIKSYQRNRSKSWELKKISKKFEKFVRDSENRFL